MKKYVDCEFVFINSTFEFRVHVIDPDNNQVIAEPLFSEFPNWVANNCNYYCFTKDSFDE